MAAILNETQRGEYNCTSLAANLRRTLVKIKNRRNHGKDAARWSTFKDAWKQ